jgi:nucleotide-binding universal stress UspA family protein
MRRRPESKAPHDRIPLIVACKHRPVTSAVLLCTDGSPLALSALRRGLEVVARGDRIAVTTVVELVHPVEVVGTGTAGGLLSVDEAEQEDAARVAAANQLLAETAEQLGIPDAEAIVLHGSPGPAICDLAASLPASVIVLGTRGRGGLRRAVLGSVSDYLVRQAPCPVVTVGDR